MVDALREAISNFSLMLRRNPCECGSEPCIAVLPRRTGAVGNLARDPVRTMTSALGGERYVATARRIAQGECVTTTSTLKDPYGKGPLREPNE